MITPCPKCSKSLEVPDGLEGKQASCPYCQHVFIIAAAPRAPGAGVAVARAPVAKGLTLKIIALVGALIMGASTFFTWWSVDTRYQPQARPEDRQKAEDEVQKMTANPPAGLEEFIENMKLTDAEIRQIEKAGLSFRDNKKVDHSLAFSGWRFSRGTITFVFGLIALALLVVEVILVAVIAGLARWCWTVQFPVALMGLMAVILGLTVWIGTPGEDFKRSFITVDRGVSIGPFLAMGGGLGLFAMALIDSLVTMVGWARSLGKARA